MSRVNKAKADDEGIGFLLEYVARLLHWYPSFTRTFVWDELPLVEGWAYYTAAYLDDPMHKFGGMRPKGSYIKQESEKLIKEAHDAWLVN